MANVLDPKKVTLIAKMHGYRNLELGEKEQKYMLRFTSAPISGSGNAGIISDAVKVNVWFTTGRNTKKNRYIHKNELVLIKNFLSYLFIKKFTFTKGTVSTHLLHPLQGWNTLYRCDIKTLEELKEIFANPRRHTDKGTYDILH